jgi:hypothetical protein
MDASVRALLGRPGDGELIEAAGAAVAAGAVVDDDMLNEFRSRFNTTPYVR